MVVLAKEKLIVDTVFGSKLKMANLATEPVYEKTILDSSVHVERERNDWNAHQKIKLQKASVS